MSTNNHDFQCFNAVGEDSHKSSLPFKHYTSHLPRILQHGTVAHHLEECCLCSEHRHAQAMEALEAHVLPSCHTHGPYHHHPQHQYVVRGPTRPEEAYSGHGHHIHHHKFNKRLMLVKNSDPSFRKTIVLHHRSLRSFGLFLEEVSELMQYHVRKLYTLEGHKIDSVQSLMQCPRVLVCVGREPSHPSIMENFLKTSHVKLPKLSARLRSSGCTEGHEGPTQKSVINPKLESDNRSNRQSLSSDKSIPDGTYSPDNVDSCPPSHDALRDDDIEKRVRVNKDGSLSMEMKVRFRLQNDETLHWSTKVRKTTDRTCEYLQGDNNACFAQVSDRRYSEPDNVSPGEQDGAYITRHYQRHAEEPHCPHCCSHCQEYDIWKNVEGTHGSGRCIQTSSSSASSHTVSRKMVVERKTMSRSSDEHSEQVVETETCVKKTVEAAETVEYCTIRREANSPKCIRHSASVDKCKAVDNTLHDHINVKTAQTSEQKDQAGYDANASSQILTVDEKNDEDDYVLPNVSRASSQKSEGEETDANEVESPKQHLTPGPTARASNASEHSNKSKKSKTSHTCHCRVSNDDMKGQINGQAEEKGEMQRDQSSAISVKSNASGRSDKTEEMWSTQSDDSEETQSKSAMSVNSNASTKSKSKVLHVKGEDLTYVDKETQDRLISNMSVRSSKSEKAVKSEVACEQGTVEDINDGRTLSSMSLKSNPSIKSNGSKLSFLPDREQADEETEQRTSSAMSARSHTPADTKYGAPEVSADESIQDPPEENFEDKSEGSIHSDVGENFEEDKQAEETERDQDRELSVISAISNTSGKSTHSKASELQDQESAKDDNEERATSVMSSKSVKSKTSEIEVQQNAKEMQHTDSKTFLSRVSSNKSDSDENVEETVERAPSTMSVESAQSRSRSTKSKVSAISTKSNVCEQMNEVNPGDVERRLERATSAMSAKSDASARSRKSERADLHARESVGITDDGNTEEETEERPQSTMSVKTTKSNISAKSSKSFGVPDKESDESYEEEIPSSIKYDEADARASSAMSEISLVSKSSKISSKSKASKHRSEEKNCDEQMAERAQSAMSAKSAKSNGSVTSTKSKASQVLPKCDICNEGDAEKETSERSISCMSDKSAKSRSSKYKCCEGSEKENITEYEKERGSSALSVKSTHSNASTKSAKSNISTKSNMSKPSDAKENAADHMEQAERASSNMSVTSTKSAESNTSGFAVLSQNCADTFEEIEESERRSVSSMSVQSVTSSISAISNKSKCSAHVPAKESFESPGEEKQSEKRAASSMSAKSLQSHVSEISIESAGRAPSLLSDKSAMSHASTKSFNSAASRITDEGDGGDETQNRSQSTLSAKSATSHLSANSEKSKYSAETPANERSEASEKEDEERAASTLSVKSIHSGVSEISIKSKERASSACSAKSAKSHASTRSIKSNVSEVYFGKTTGVSDEADSGEENQEKAPSSKSTISAKSTKGMGAPAEENISDHEENEDIGPSNMSVRSAKSTKSSVSASSKKSKVSCISSKQTANISVKANEEEHNESRSASSMSVHSVKSNVSASSKRSKCSAKCRKSNAFKVPPETNIPKGENHQEETQNRAGSAMSVKSIVSVTSNESNFLDNSAVENEQRSSSNLSKKSSASAKSDVSETSKKSKPFDLHSDHSTDIAEAENEGRMSSMSAQSVKPKNSARSKMSTCCDVPAEKDFEINGENHKQTEERVASRTSHVSERSFTSQVSGVTTEDVVEHVNISERAPSALSVKSARSNATVKSVTFKEKTEDNVEQVSTSMPAKSNSSGTSAKACLEKETKERPQSIMSVQSTESNMSLSSRGTSASKGPSEENAADDEEIVERPTSTLSAKSSRSAKSTQSNISRRSQACNVPGDKTHTENIDRAPSSTSIISTKSAKSNSTALSMELKASGVPAEDCANITDTEGDTEKRATSTVSAKSLKSNVTSVSTKSKVSGVPAEDCANITDTEGDTEKRATSSVSAKSLKSNVTSVSTKSKASHSSPSKNNEEDAEESRSVVSVKSDVSARTMKSSVSRITPCERTGHGEQTDERPHSDMSTKSKKSNNSTKSNILKTPEIPATESSDNEANAEKKSGRASSAMSAKSTMSVRSEKSKVSDILADTRQKEGRTPSPVSANSNTSEMLSRYEVPAVTVEKSEERAHTVLSSNSKVSAHSKKSSKNKERKSEGQSQGSLSVKSDLSMKSRKSRVTDIVTIEDLENKKKFEMCRAVRIPAEQKTTVSNESDLSQTLSSSDVVKEMREIPVTGESKSTVTEGIINGPLEITDNKSDNNTDADDFDLVPSRLPNASPTEVVNEWLKRIPTESDMYEMEELSENCEADTTDHTTEEIHKQDNNDSVAVNTEHIGVLKNSGPDNDCHTGSEAPNEDNTSTQRDDASKVFHSSVQVMKVLLNPKLDRCNSLPEVSPVYGRKLSTSARGLLDCLVKLQLIDHDPKNTNEMAKRYQELMNILQSLWLCDPPENKQVLDKGHRHSVDNECNHTSSSGVDVNSGSTGSGKSSDGVKTNDGGNCDMSQPPTGADMLGKVQDIGQAENQKTSEREVEGMHEENQKEDDPATDETIRSNESPRELPETPPSSNKSSETDNNAQKHSGEVETECPEDTKSGSPLLVQRAQLANRISQDPDPVWVLKLLTKIEKQFMTHYINAMREFKVRWNLDDNEQLNMMIGELETEVRKRIQKSIDRELRKIQGRAGLPRPPKETMSRASTTQTEERRQRLKIMLKQSIDTQTEKSNDSATGTSYSDQRSEDDVEYCPCETCIRKKVTSKPPLPIMNAAPVILDFDLKRILVMKNSDPDKGQALTCASHDENHIETTAAVTLVERAIVKAVREVEGDEEHYDTEDSFKVVLDEKEAESAAETTMSEDVNAAEETAVVVSPELQSHKDQAGKFGSVEERDEIAATSKDDSTESMSNTTASALIAVTSEGELEEETAEIYTVEETAVAAATEHASAKGKDVEEENLENEEEIHIMGAVNPADENNGTGEDETNGEAAEDEEGFPIEAFTEPESDTDEAVDAGGADELNDESDDVTTEGENAADDVTSISKHESDESDKEELVEEGIDDHDELEDEETTGDDSSKEPAEEETTEDEIAVKKETAITSKDASMDNDNEEAASGEETFSASEDDSAEDAAGNEDEAAEENYPTGNEWSKEPTEEAITEDEHSLKVETAVTREDEPEEEPSEATTTESKNPEETLVVTASEEESNKEETAEEGTDDNEEELASTSAEESAHDNYGTAMPGDASEDPNEEAETGDEMTLEKGITKEERAVDETAVEETSVAAITENESDKEEADGGEEAVATSDNDFTNNAMTNEARIEDDDAMADELPEEPADVATEKEMDFGSEDEAKTEFAEATKAEDENAAGDYDVTVNEPDKDDALETEADDNSGQAADTSDEDENTDTDKAATAEHESGTDKNNALTGEDESEDSSAAEEADDVTTTEHDSDKDAAVEKEILATSAFEFESDEQEIAEKVSSEDENGKEIETAMTGEDQIKIEAGEATTADKTNAVEYVTDTTEHESEKEEAAKEAVSSSEDEGLDATTNDETAEENDNIDEAAVGTKAVTTNDTAREAENSCEEEICQADESKEEEMEETTGGEECVDPEHASGESYTENESEEESYESATDENKSETNTVTDANESAREEDISNVSNDNESGDEHLGAKPENKPADETAEDDKPAMEENKTLSEKDPVEMAPAKELQEREPSEIMTERSSTVDFLEEDKGEEDDAVELVETAGDESEEADNESEMFLEHKSGTEAVAAGDETEEHETAAEESGEPETAGNETTESDGGEECGTQGVSEGDEECTEDESAQDDRQPLTEGEDKEVLEDPDKEKQRCIDITEEHQEGPNDETEGPDDVVELKPGEDKEVEDINEDDVEKGDNTLKEDNENDDGQTETNVTKCEFISFRNGSHDTDTDDVQAFEKEEEKTKTPSERWCRIQGDSADGEDEAEEDSDGPEKETDDEEQDLVSSKTRDKLVLFNQAAEETTLIPLDTLIKVNAESEDGAYADVEDSETELNSQEDITGLEPKKILP